MDGHELKWAHFRRIMNRRLSLSENATDCTDFTAGGIHYLRSMPREWKVKSGGVSIPEEKELLLKRIWKAGKTKACFDVFAWQGKRE